MAATADIAPPPTEGRVQPLLFGELPEVVDEVRAARRARAAARQRQLPSEPGSADTTPALAASAPLLAPQPAPEPAVFDPAALSQAELRALVQALPDSKLGFLLTEAARTLKKRILEGNGAEDDAGDGRQPPDPALLRAAGLAVAELSGEDDCGSDFGERRPAAATARTGNDRGTGSRATRSPARRG